MPSDKRPTFLFITPGDLNGIGLEVSIKALKKILSSREKVRFKNNLLNFFVWISPSQKNLIKKEFKSAVFFDQKKYPGLDVLCRQLKSYGQVGFIVSSLKPPLWVSITAEFLLSQPQHRLITGPMSKELFISSGFKDMGHTGMLKRMSQKEALYMAFMSKKINLLLLTGHIPLKDVEEQLTSKNLLKSAVNELIPFLEKNPGIKRTIGILGLNPHAGEGGLIGDFEGRSLAEQIKALKPHLNKKGFKIIGPLSPDSAFLPHFRKSVGFYISLYHDQGLIAFKLLNGANSGFHFTLGLPFLRTSVDHGTAKDIFGLGKANPGSMHDAILYGAKLGF